MMFLTEVAAMIRQRRGATHQCRPRASINSVRMEMALLFMTWRRSENLGNVIACIRITRHVISLWARACQLFHGSHALISLALPIPVHK
jgi:hypothetical protein